MTAVSVSPERPAPPSGTVASILVVDDDEPVRDAVERGLGLHGYAVIGAADAEVAFGVVAKRRPDLLVLDIGLPGISGIELCQRLRDVDVDVRDSADRELRTFFWHLMQILSRRHA